MSNFSDSRGYHGNTKDADLGKLLKQGASDQQVLATLREKYPNDRDLVSKVFSEYEEKMSRIRRKAQKFAQLILTRYSHLGPKRIMEKARKYKKKYEFSDDEFSAFVNIALSDKAFANTNNNYNVPNTPMSRALGHTSDVQGKMLVKPNELETLQEILRMHQENGALHTQVIVQSLLYNECSIQAMYGKYENKKDNVYSHVSPVLAALFLPRIRYLDEHMLIASISGVVASRNAGTPIRTQPDYELYYDMITDPNEVACTTNRDSPIADLRNRVRLQVELWKNVRDLRMGRYFSPDAANFSSAVDACRNNVFDTPDMAHVRDEGAILRRLMGAFSLRPTVVAIQTITSNAMSLNYPLNSLALTQVTTIPIINIRLPLNPPAGSTVNMQNALRQPDWYVENKLIVPKHKQVMYSRELIVFYVNRRYQNLNFGKLTMPYQFGMLPTTVTGFESLNDAALEFTPVINLPSDNYKLKSFVSVVTTNLTHARTDDPKSLIVGSKAWVNCVDASASSTQWYCYHPTACVNATGVDATTATATYPAPINKASESDVQSAFAKEGTLYIFCKEASGSGL